LVLVVSSVIYLFGCLLPAKSVRGGEGKSAYACGEKANFGILKISISQHRYLIYFIILDSSVLSAAFMSLALHMSNAFLFMVYLLVVLTSSLLLLEGDDH
jgi:hypothetical protein